MTEPRFNPSPTTSIQLEQTWDPIQSTPTPHTPLYVTLIGLEETLHFSDAHSVRVQPAEANQKLQPTFPPGRLSEDPRLLVTLYPCQDARGPFHVLCDDCAVYTATGALLYKSGYPGDA